MYLGCSSKEFKKFPKKKKKHKGFVLKSSKPLKNWPTTVTQKVFPLNKY